MGRQSGDGERDTQDGSILSQVTGTTTFSGGTVAYTAASGSQTVAVKYVNLTIRAAEQNTRRRDYTDGNLSVIGGTFDLSTLYG